MTVKVGLEVQFKITGESTSSGGSIVYKTIQVFSDYVHTTFITQKNGQNYYGTSCCTDVSDPLWE